MEGEKGWRKTVMTSDGMVLMGEWKGKVEEGDIGKQIGRAHV